ncbi:MAG: ABC transporter permease, partial [Gammaproteobacteria bacterium]
MPVILWTDALLILLLATLGAYVLHVSRSPQLRRSWREVVHSRAAMASAVVLATFMLVAVLDSIQLHPPVAATTTETGRAAEQHYSAEMISALDWLLAPLRQRVEKTYSAPFATHAFAMESMELADGRVARGYPRLRYGGAHLANPESKYRDIAVLALRATLVSILLWSLMCAVVAGALARRSDDGFFAAAGRMLRG